VFAVVAGRAGLDRDAVLAACRAKLANYKCPKGVEIWPALPKSTAGKILRREVRDRIVAREKRLAAG
jgi:acyl-CoA synthetase (AMP-forming)/AMP-acid ligase II